MSAAAATPQARGSHPAEMAETKLKSRGGRSRQKERGVKRGRDSKSKTLNPTGKMPKRAGGERKKSGPRLPSQLRKQVEALNPNPAYSDEEIRSDDGGDVYEYEEGVAEEESRKNRRYDPVENYEYELPEEYVDEDVPSDDDDDVEDGYGRYSKEDAQWDSSSESEDEAEEDDTRKHASVLQGTTGLPSEEDLLSVDGDGDEDRDSGRYSEDDHEENWTQLDDEVEEEDAEKNSRILQEITGLPREAFEDKKKDTDIVICEPYKESEYNPTRDVLEGKSLISLQDLLKPFEGRGEYSKIRKRIQRVEKKSMSVHAPLPKVDQDRLERRAAYEQSKKDITKWEPLVKKNREAPTLSFKEDVDLEFSTVGAIASGFEPRNEFEKKMNLLLNNDKVVDAHKNDGARLLEMNKISIEDVRDHQNHVARMRSLLFRHEMKAKRIKKIKSKTYHRLLKKERLKVMSAEMQLDPEAAKEIAMKQEYKRAEERMTQRHKNSSKWAKRIIKRGLHAQDEGTRAAISEQLHQHNLLTRKMNSMKDGSSSSDDGSDDDDDEGDLSAGSDQDGPSKLLAKAKDKTLKVIEQEDEAPNSGVLALPFMVRGLKKREEAAYEEAKLALEDFESSLNQLEDKGFVQGVKVGASSGRRVFNAAKQVQEASKKIKSDNYDDSDSEDNILKKESIDDQRNNSHELFKDVKVDPNMLHDSSEIVQNLDGIVSVPAPTTTYEAAICTSDSWKKVKRNTDAATVKKSSTIDQDLKNKDEEEGSEDSDSDSGGQMVDGILSSVAKPMYKLPSQAELIQRAFAGDDVEEDFEKDKLEVLNKENPEPEKPALLPGWGQWTDIQKKKGLPSWMLEEHEIAKKKREEALKKRKDAHLKNVFISEKLDKKAEKLQTKTLPYPYTSKEVFEKSIRMPIGPEFNPAAAVRALNRPEVLKKPGAIIKPIKYEDVDVYEVSEEHAHGGQKHKVKKNKSRGGNTIKKIKAKKGKS